MFVIQFFFLCDVSALWWWQLLLFRLFIDVCNFFVLFCYFGVRCILNTPLGIVNESSIWFVGCKIFRRFGVRLKSKIKRETAVLGPIHRRIYLLCVVWAVSEVINVNFVQLVLMCWWIERKNEWMRGGRQKNKTQYFDNNYSSLERVLGAAIQISVTIDSFKWSSVPLFRGGFWVKSVIWNS